ncbi:hypothetical protein [Microbacterium hydrothermale]|nr:hypothetical protein [Microbacterium hydrothermale]
MSHFWPVRGADTHHNWDKGASRAAETAAGSRVELPPRGWAVLEA